MVTFGRDPPKPAISLRGIDGGNAVALLDGVIYLPTTPRRAIAEVMSPRRAITV